MSEITEAESSAAGNPTNPSLAPTPWKGSFPMKPPHARAIDSITSNSKPSTTFTLKRTRQLEDLGVTGSFDSTHLRSIHRHLFQNVFPWAGDFRAVNISKGNSTFGPALHIASALNEALAKLKAECNLANLNA